MPRLEIKDYSLQAHLGCSEEERKKPQEVRINMELRFGEVPQACNTDQLADTFCYEALLQSLKKIYTEGEFRTIEHMVATGLAALSKTYPTLGITLRVHKVAPPIPGLLGGVFFELKN